MRIYHYWIHQLGDICICFVLPSRFIVLLSSYFIVWNPFLCLGSGRDARFYRSIVNDDRLGFTIFAML